MTLSVALLGTDLIGQARTGTGKTLAFGIPLLQRTAVPGTPAYDELAAPGKPQALVVAPTRELAVQVSNDLTLAAADLGARVLTVYGGVPYEPQLDALKAGVDVVVGTPGRLIDLVNRGSLVLSHVQVLVLDEADEMLDLGFLPDVERLLRETPASRQTMLFSATMPGAIVSLARSHMHHPVNIRAESAADTQMVPATAQFIFQVHDLDKTEMLARIFQAEGAGRAIVFTRTKRAAQRVADDLAERGFPASPLHGDMAQVAREKALQRFREGKVRVMVATDVAARGIDVQDVTHVINHSCPEDHNTYVHRIGRTGRAGATGVAITFVDWQDVTRWNVINKALDLPHNDPPETYSTSPHFFELLGIPSDVKGYVGEPVGGPRKDKDAGKPRNDESRQRPPRKRNDRTRTRTRGGQKVDGAPEASESSESSESSVSAAASDPSSSPAAETQGDGTAAPARRRRRRRSGGGGGSAPAEG
ncbi:DEAD/DEAH box helicase [Nocardioides marmoribigeumensis]|uniref:RNA helicase n=1 Tax=Nocardioides marmoribigeumensis TaxID=433649 RepID=A0ABU2BV92_9ACTN|nr:superfamily II DNA/RNA helicase [Nocardioides marmoribigeumensis]